MSFFGKSPSFDKLIDKATSHLLLEPDWNSNMLACDMVRQGEVTGKYALQVVRKKLNNANPHVVLYSLNLIESMAKNCGSSIHDEISTSDFMNQMKGLVKEKDPVKAKALELIQLWAHAFRNQPKYSIVQNTYNNLKSAGHSFQPLTESDAMFMSENAPEWQDSDSCYRCKVVFSTLKRKSNLLEKLTKSQFKHHCRNCGNIFCDECTSKRSNIPKYGIEKEVRVCDSCHDILKGKTKNKKGVQFNEDVTVKNYTPDQREAEAARLQKEKELELQEKEELELALALSASEAESQSMKKTKPPQSEVKSSPNSEPTFNGMYSTLDTSEMDPELARYLNRNYWENKAAAQSGSVKITQPSAPVLPNSPVNVMQSPVSDNRKSTDIITTNSDIKSSSISAEQNEFLTALHSSIEIFVNRMQSNKQRGRSIANDSSVQTLFLTLNAMHPQLLQYINEQDDKRNYYESLQDKLTQLRDAREALDALREEHKEKKRREEEEAQRLRQIQMMQKLEIMRQKKKEYLDYQRQLAVDRLHQQEREMAMRMAQQNQMMQMRQYQQQYPYSVSQHQQQQFHLLPNPAAGVGVEQNPATDAQHTNNTFPNLSNMQGMGGNEMYNYGMSAPVPPQDFYNIQGISQNHPTQVQSNHTMGHDSQHHYVPQMVPTGQVGQIQNPVQGVGMPPQVPMYSASAQWPSGQAPQISKNEMTAPTTHSTAAEPKPVNKENDDQLISFD